MATWMWGVVAYLLFGILLVEAIRQVLERLNTKDGSDIAPGEGRMTLEAMFSLLATCALVAVFWLPLLCLFILALPVLWVADVLNPPPARAG